MEIGEFGKVIETDVLVLGGGVAGCAAALAARDQGARVTVVDKGSLEACGQAGPGNANLHTHLGVAKWDSAEEYTKFWGRYLEAAISPLIFHKAVSQRTHDMLKRLEAIGIKFHKDPDSGYRRTAGLGQPYPWTTTMVNGKYLKRLLAKEVRRLGAKVADHVMLTKILVDKGNARVAGATGFHIWSGEFYVFRAKTVVLCLSTTNERISTSSTNNPFNTMYPFNTGSGPLMAYDAGAKIVALEKSRATIMPMGFAAPGMAAFTGMGAYYVNAAGERYVFRYDPRGEKAPQNTLLLATYHEIVKGSGPCYIDARHLPQKDMEHMVRERLYVDSDTYPEYFTQRGLDLKKDLMEIEVGEIRGGGCLLVNDGLESSIKGLFGYSPAGLSNAMCGGYSSAVEASKNALKTEKLPEIDVDLIAKEKERVFAPLKRDSGLAWREYEDVIRQVMNYYMGHLRSQQGMELALEKLKKIEEHVGEIKADNYHELLRANEAMHLVRYCQLVVRSALERKESGRNCYKRVDYPAVDPRWDRKEVVQWQERGEPQIAVRTLGE